MGGDSLKAVSLSAFEKMLGVKVEIKDISLKTPGQISCFYT